MKLIEDQRALAQLADNINIESINCPKGKECDVKYKVNPGFFDLLETKTIREMFQGKDLDSIVKTVILAYL
jgi:hypothetical protein